MRIVMPYHICFFLFFFFSLTTGCAKMISPYPTEPPCRAEPGGECQSAYEAHAGSRNLTVPNDSGEIIENLYQQQLFAQYRQLLTDEITPVVAPPRILRMYIVPHEQNNRLHAGQYIYWQAAPPTWVLENLLLDHGKQP